MPQAEHNSTSDYETSHNYAEARALMTNNNCHCQMQSNGEFGDQILSMFQNIMIILVNNGHVLRADKRLPAPPLFETSNKVCERCSIIHS